MPPLSIATSSTPTAAPNSGPATGPGQPPLSASAPGAAATGDQGSAGGGTAHARPPSPPPPPVSPITPTLRAARLAGSSSSGGPAIPVPTTSGSSTHYTADPSPSAMTFFAANRVALTHSSQPAQAAGALNAPPPPLPLDFDANPDVLALKSAISVLQIQRARAAADVARLSRAKAAALEEPDAFLRDLAEGRVSTAPTAPTLFGTGGGDASESESESDSSESDGADHASHPTADDLGKGKQPAIGESSDRAYANGGTGYSTQTKEKKKKKKGHKPQQPPWRELPQRQNVVRCPPINWAQYAVVGESLEKLHNEQLTRPDLGAPRVVGSGGVYEFKGDQRQQPGGAQQAQRLVGVASPYTPGRDRLDKKPKKPKPPT